uniref:Uncharacterized protein n=1 Tax=Corethron hystrix TaxID=216773 RepID=A0A7S1B3Z3_9STRA|mmetsp:Transcript_11864/g.26013  ORF Transcript_11864/g.26013 Transcript_11864/m.26013 type:complete len:438 (+) Transcript_11864:351-1664(+)
MRVVIAVTFLLHLESIEAFSPNIVFRPSFLSATCMRSTAETTSSKSFDAFETKLDEDEPDYFSDVGDKAMSWQENLEVLLDPNTDNAKRQVLLSDLVSARDDIKDSVAAAVNDRNIDPILTPRGKQIREGTRTVAKQLTTDIIPSILEAASNPDLRDRTAKELPSLLPKVGQRIADAVVTQAIKNFEDFQGDIADPSRIPERLSAQREAIESEVRNVFSEVPENYSSPKYDLVETGLDYEIREYEGYFSAATPMASVGDKPTEYDIATYGGAFNALAAYTFGANVDGKSMDMTTPVATTSAGEMRFYLNLDKMEEAPAPLASEDRPNEKGAVVIVEVPPARLAVRKFTGFATDGEVQRQKDSLLSSLAADSVEIDVDHGVSVPHLVFQYNPPYTIPVIRRNEIAVPVVEAGAVVTKKDLDIEWDTSKNEVEPPSDVE